MKAELLPFQPNDPANPHSEPHVALRSDVGRPGILRIFHHNGPPSVREIEALGDDRSLEEGVIGMIEKRTYYEREFALKVAKLVLTAINELPALMAENRQLRETLALKQAQETIAPFGRTPVQTTASLHQFISPRIIDVPNQEEGLAREIGRPEGVYGYTKVYTRRVTRCLNEMDIGTVRELVEKTARDLLAHEGFGAKGLLEIREDLHHYGLRLKDDPEFVLPKNRYKPRKKKKKK